MHTYFTPLFLHSHHDLHHVARTIFTGCHDGLIPTIISTNFPIVSHVYILHGSVAKASLPYSLKTILTKNIDFFFFPVIQFVRVRQIYIYPSAAYIYMCKYHSREALTKLIDRKAMLPSVTEVRVAKCAQRCIGMAPNSLNLTNLT